MKLHVLEQFRRSLKSPELRHKRKIRTKEDHERDNELVYKFVEESDQDAFMELLYSYRDIIAMVYNNPQSPPYVPRRKRKYVFYLNEQDKEDLFMTIIEEFLRLTWEYNPEISTFEGLIRGALHIRVYKRHFNKLHEYKTQVSIVAPDTMEVIERILYERASLVKGGETVSFELEIGGKKYNVELEEVYESLTKRQKQFFNLYFERNIPLERVKEHLGNKDSKSVLRLRKRVLEKVMKKLKIAQ